MFMQRLLIGTLCATGLLPSVSDAAPECLGLPPDVVCVGGVCNGTALDDVIVGTNGADTINGLGGNDVICGLDGADLIRGHAGDDIIVGGDGSDDLSGNSGNDILRGQQGDDILRGGAGDDVVSGGFGVDVCDGGPGDDHLGQGYMPLVAGDSCETALSLEATLAPSVAMTSVSPSATGAEVDDPVGGNHMVFVDASVAERDRILVHFSGTFGRPVRHSLFLQTVASQGVRAIGLQYVNNGSVNGICELDWQADPRPDPDCMEAVRLERIYGNDSSTLVSVSAGNGIVNRLTRLLEHLDALQPAAGWAAFLDDGAPRWDRIVVSGLSQGSGMAALIARDQAVARVLMFAGPFDTDPFGDTAAWMTDPKATPIGRHYGFRHIDDPLFVNPASWDDMALPGPPVVVDTAAPPYDNSHFLETNIAVPANARHGAVLRNTLTGPAGRPQFASVWRYMCCSPQRR